MSKPIVIPMGKIYFDPDGEGEMLMGQSRNAQIAITQSVEEVYDTDEPSGGLVLYSPYNVQRELKFQCAEITDLVVGLFTRTSQRTHNQEAGSVSQQIVTVKPGRRIQLGATPTNPSGVRDITGLSVAQFIVGGTLDAITSGWTGDLATGGLYFAADWSGPAEVRVNYTVSAASWEQHYEDPAAAPVTGSIRFVANNVSGPNRDIFFPSIRLAADGEWDLKGDQNQKAIVLAFKGKPFRTGDLPAMYIDGRPA